MGKVEKLEDSATYAKMRVSKQSAKNMGQMPFAVLRSLHVGFHTNE